MKSALNLVSGIGRTLSILRASNYPNVGVSDPKDYSPLRLLGSLVVATIMTKLEMTLIKKQ